MITRSTLLFALAAAVAAPLLAQTTIPWDTSGNGLLSGNYYYRQIIYSTGETGTRRALSLYGAIVFSGNGTYTLSGQVADSTNPSQTKALSVGGTYAVGSHGLGFMDSPLVKGDLIYGLVSQGVFVGSSTEGPYKDVFVAVPAGTTAATRSTFQGKYWVAAIDLPGGRAGQARDALFALNANGNGGTSGSTSVSGYIAGSSAAVTQNISSISYSFTNGIGLISFPAAGTSTLISGDKSLFVSPDGNFAVGGSPNGFDLFVAVRAPSGFVSNSTYKGLYYNAGVDEDNSNPGGVILDTYYGALNADGAGGILRHERHSPDNRRVFDWTYDTAYSLNSDGSYDRSAFRYAVGNNGIGVVGIGKGPGEGLIIGVRAPDFNGNGVYLNPTGIVNAASSAPFTSGIARGELITLYGGNLAGDTNIAQSLPFPTTLSGVQVTINDRFAPIYFVSPSQVSVIVPYDTELSFAKIVVNNNGFMSNSVTLFVNPASPGIFSVPPGGVGSAAVLHADYSLVSTSNPARKGETVQVFLTGLGDVNPPVPAGNPGQLTSTTTAFDVFVDDKPATITYSGLAPGLAGLYQMNIVIPISVTAAPNVRLDVQAPQAYTSQVTIAVQ